MLGCMGTLLVSFILVFFPRFIIIMFLLFSDWIQDAYDTWMIPIIGFIFMPCTTFVYAAASHYSNGESLSVGWLILGSIAIVIDLLHTGFLGAVAKKA